MAHTHTHIHRLVGYYHRVFREYDSFPRAVVAPYEWNRWALELMCIIHKQWTCPFHSLVLLPRLLLLLFGVIVPLHSCWLSPTVLLLLSMWWLRIQHAKTNNSCLQNLNLNYKMEPNLMRYIFISVRRVYFTDKLHWMACVLSAFILSHV